MWRVATLAARITSFPKQYAFRRRVRVYLQRGLQIERTTSPSRTPSPRLVAVSKWPPCHVVLASGRPPGELKVRPPGSPLGSTMTLVKFLWGEPFEGERRTLLLRLEVVPQNRGGRVVALSWLFRAWHGVRASQVWLWPWLWLCCRPP